MSSEEQQDIRNAAETIYRNAHRPNYSPSRYELSRSHVNLDLINLINEDYIAGYMQDGRMSVVRRFFCLFVTFDIFFISLLWFMCIMLNGDTIVNALKVQVLHYTIQSSLFDIILVAFIRFVLLILFYGIFAMDHWFIIALTTTGSCAFLIGKVFYYNWMVSAQPIIQVLMIIVSCLLAWGEAWFLDCRVIPQEKNAQRFYRLLMSQAGDNERSPLLAPYLNAVRANLGATDSSIANFYSPIESAHNSDSEDDQNELYINQGIQDVKTACELLEANGWKVEKVIATTGDQIKSLHRKPLGKVFRLTGQMRVPARILLHKLYYGIENMPAWNPTVLESRILKKIDNHTDITYQVSASGGGGLVESRDFVNLRCWQLIKNGNIFVESDAAHDLATLIKNSHSQPIPLELNSQQRLRKANSDTLLTEEHDQMNSTMKSLSKSLGAKMLANESNGSTIKDDTIESNETDVFVDARESQSTLTTSVKSIENRSTTEPSIDNDNCDKMYIVSGVSVKYDHIPTSKYTRGENLMGCWAIRESKTDPDVCIFEWLLCLDLKGRFPRFVLDKAYTNVMQEFMSHLRKYCDEPPHV